MERLFEFRFSPGNCVTLGIAFFLLPFQVAALSQGDTELPANAPSKPVGPKPSVSAAVPIPALTAKHSNVYKSQFDKKVEKGRWAPSLTGKAPNGRKFLGEHSGRGPVVFTLGDLPEHRYVRLRCDLLILKTWDGVDNGPVDHLSISEVGGPLLLLSTFCTQQSWKDPKKAPPSHRQNYPDEYHFTTHEAGTGLSGEGAALGFEFREDLNVADSIYKIDIIFPHTGKDLALRFYGSLNGDVDDESWGLDKVVVDTVDAESPLDDRQLATLWEQISGENPIVANNALWRVIAAGPEALASIEDHWEKLQSGGLDMADPAIVALKAKIKKLVVGLGSEVFSERELANKELSRLGAEALGILEAELETSKDPELRRGLTTVVTRIRREKEEEEADGHLPVVASRVSHIRRIVTTSGNGYKITSSPTPKNNHDVIGAPADGYVRSSSSDTEVPRWTWYPRRGSKEWLQYEFKEPKTISAAEVFWFHEPHTPNCALPESWRLLYQTPAGDWKPVEPKGGYTIEADKMNRVKFKPVLTGAVRLEAQLQEGRSAGLHEFGISHPEPAR